MLAGATVIELPGPLSLHLVTHIRQASVRAGRQPHAITSRLTACGAMHALPRVPPTYYRLSLHDGCRYYSTWVARRVQGWCGGDWGVYCMAMVQL